MDERPGELVLAVDIGGGSVKLALTDSAAADVQSDVVDGVPDLDRDSLLGEIGGAADSLLRSAAVRSRRLAGIAIGVPGFVSDDRRASLNSNVPVLDGIDLVSFFGDRFGCRVDVENDANLAALGEWFFGPWSAAARFMMMTLGTGIGVALLDRGQPVSVVGGTLGDAGHIVVDPAGTRSCRLGCRGCLESVASGVALLERAEELAGQFPDSALGELRRGGAAITAADVAHLAASGDGATLSLLMRTAHWLGMGLATYINAFAPDVICVGGGMSRLRPYIEETLIDSMKQGRIKNRPGPKAIYFSADFDRAAARGAAALFFGKQDRSHG